MAQKKQESPADRVVLRAKGYRSSLQKGEVFITDSETAVAMLRADTASYPTFTPADLVGAARQYRAALDLSKTGRIAAEVEKTAEEFGVRIIKKSASKPGAEK